MKVGDLVLVFDAGMGLVVGEPTQVDIGDGDGPRWVADVMYPHGTYPTDVEAAEVVSESR